MDGSHERRGGTREERTACLGEGGIVMDPLPEAWGDAEHGGGEEEEEEEEAAAEGSAGSSAPT